MFAKIVGLFAVFVAVASASDASTNPCADDIFGICGMPFPEEYLAVYDARLCLKENSLFVSKKCQDYVNTVTPSIIEPCFKEIRSYCKNVQPGGNRIHTCLSKYEKDISEECTVALSRAETTVTDEIQISTKEATPLSKVDVMNQTILAKMFAITQLQQSLSKVSVFAVPSFALSLLEDLYVQMDVLEESISDILQSINLQALLDSGDDELEAEEDGEEQANEYYSASQLTDDDDIFA